MSDVAFIGQKNRYAGERITVSTSSIGLTASTLNNEQSYGTDVAKITGDNRCNTVQLTVVTSPVYYTLDASVPSASNGTSLSAGDVLYVSGYQKCANLRFVRNGGADATVVVDFYKD